MTEQEHAVPSAIPEAASGDHAVTFRGAVDAWECDQMGHLNVRFYGRCFSMAERWIFRSLLNEGQSIYAERESISFRAELRSGTPISIRSFRSSAEPRLSLLHELRDEASNRVAASARVDYVLRSDESECRSSLSAKLSHLPIAAAAAPTSRPDRRRVRAEAILSGRRVITADDLASEDLRRETLIHIANQAVPHLGLDTYRRRDPTGRLKIGSAIVRLDIERLRPVPESEAISVFSRVTEIGARSLGLVHEVFRDEKTIVTRMQVTMVFIDMETRHAIPIPSALRDSLELA